VRCVCPTARADRSETKELHLQARLLTLMAAAIHKRLSQAANLAAAAGVPKAADDGGESWWWQALASSCGLATYAQFRGGKRRGGDSDARVAGFDLAIAKKQAQLAATEGPGKDSKDLATLLSLAGEKQAVLVECHAHAHATIATDAAARPRRGHFVIIPPRPRLYGESP
jgi:hypothetical protein